MEVLSRNDLKYLLLFGSLGEIKLGSGAVKGIDDAYQELDTISRRLKEGYIIDQQYVTENSLIMQRLGGLNNV